MLKRPKRPECMHGMRLMPGRCYALTGLGKPLQSGREQPRDQDSTEGMRPTASQSAAARSGSPSSWYCIVKLPEPESPLPLYVCAGRTTPLSLLRCGV